jgi:hypothetical protein
LYSDASPGNRATGVRVIAFLQVSRAMRVGCRLAEARGCPLPWGARCSFERLLHFLQSSCSWGSGQPERPPHCWGQGVCMRGQPERPPHCWGQGVCVRGQPERPPHRRGQGRPTEEGKAAPLFLQWSCEGITVRDHGKFLGMDKSLWVPGAAWCGIEKTEARSAGGYRPVTGGWWSERSEPRGRIPGHGVLPRAPDCDSRRSFACSCKPHIAPPVAESRAQDWTK